jgi:hypothetical protein
VIVQVVLAVVLTCLVLPVFVVSVPAMRNAAVGYSVMGGTIVGMFALIRTAWPRRKQP